MCTVVIVTASHFPSPATQPTLLTHCPLSSHCKRSTPNSRHKHFFLGMSLAKAVTQQGITRTMRYGNAHQGLSVIILHCNAGRRNAIKYCHGVSTSRRHHWYLWYPHHGSSLCRLSEPQNSFAVRSSVTRVFLSLQALRAWVLVGVRGIGQEVRSSCDGIRG